MTIGIVGLPPLALSAACRDAPRWSPHKVAQRSILAVGFPRGHPLKARSDPTAAASILLSGGKPFQVSPIDETAAEPRHRQLRLDAGAVLPLLAGDKRSPCVNGMAMDTGLYRVEMTGLSRLAGTIGSFSRWPEKAAVKYFEPKLIWLPAAILIVVGAWMLLPGSASNTPQTSNSEPVRLAVAAAVTESAPSSTDLGQDLSSLLSPATTPAGAITPMETSPLDGLKISSQSWRRGGLGSKALVTLTLRNTNDYAVKDIEIFCSFARRDGSHLTDRKRVIPDIVNMRSRRTFARMHVGFVNINADRAKCSLVAASQV